MSAKTNPSRKPVKVVKASKASTEERRKKPAVRNLPFIKDHVLALEHSKASERELKELLTKFQITKKELPKILKNDPAIRDLNLEEGDVVKIKRKSATSGESDFYREVINA
jgi:DNA-directed RNA polymerase subunit H